MSSKVINLHGRYAGMATIEIYDDGTVIINICKPGHMSLLHEQFVAEQPSGASADHVLAIVPVSEASDV